VWLHIEIISRAHTHTVKRHGSQILGCWEISEMLRDVKRMRELTETSFNNITAKMETLTEIAWEEES
jgi:hypothetical protein